ncbi:imidazole glycerol phosphate synthase, glutamine amidotransferase subunit [Thermanaerovibrio velox DSM 12556]|uniref:Imidazole glycerol phosphate synthase, glutamine amidotransferase subunit n=2 Tax=Thermanaerovibrio TaxID=81461 RepID=H0USF8_9BACT|nr:imidazole glycerol phosphate synthase, glutamine amidotransferase subunit [Thermanaerovibrio velox DSM 12556]
MSPMALRIGVVSNGLGNVGSVISALSFYGYEVDLLSDPSCADRFSLLVLSGVGTYGAAVKAVKELRMWDLLCSWKDRGLPVVGICLGMQLFASVGEEEGENRGFDWIPGRVCRMEGVRVPHMGWDMVTPSGREEAEQIFKGVRYGAFYFMHTYHFQVYSEEHVLARFDCGGKSFVAAVARDNVMGFQFHPEKSQGDGLRVLRSAVEVLCR